MGQESLPRSEAAAHALHMAQKMVSVTFEKEKWDVILEAVVKDVGAMVSLQDFVGTCKRLARCARLLQYLDLEVSAAEIPRGESQSLQRWQDISQDVAQRLSVSRRSGHSLKTLEDEDADLRRVLEASAREVGKAEKSSSGRTAAPSCDLCKAAGGTCSYHAKSATGAAGGRGSASSSSASGSSSSSYALMARSSASSSGSAQGTLPKRTSSQLAQAEAKKELLAAVASRVVPRLEDAIVAAADAGVDEDELLPAFARLEEFWEQGVTCN